MSSQPIGKLVERALRKAVHRQVSHTDKRARLEAIADKAVELAMEGDTSMIAFVADRLDGKAKQQIEMDVNNRMTIVIGAARSLSDTSTAPILDVAQDGTTSVLARDIETTDTTELPPPAPYEQQKIQRYQRVRGESVDGEVVDAAASRISRLRAKLAADTAPIVPVRGAEAAHACAYVAAGQQSQPCAVCQRVPSCPALARPE